MMKNLYLRRMCIFSLFFLTIATASNAQVKFGLKGGFNVSNLTGFAKMYNSTLDEGEDGIKTELKFGYSAGVSMIIPVKQVFLQVDLEYNLQGLKAKAKADADNDEIDGEEFKLHYLKLPVQLGYKYNLNPDVGVVFGAGVYGGYAISGDDYLTDDLNFKKMDFGLTASVGVEFVAHRIALSYDHGLTDLMDVENWSDYKKQHDLSSVRNYSIRLAYTYYF